MIGADGTVRRPAGFWSPAVHALLRHFEHVGFEGAPRALGVDGEGRETLSYVDGHTPTEGAAPAGDDIPEKLGELLRCMHDAQKGFLPPADAQWQIAPGTVSGDEVVCHNDPLGTNVIFRHGRPCALIDWELAAPGPRLADVAAAAVWWSPLRRDVGAERWGLPTERRGKRLRRLADGYGLKATGRASLPEMILRVTHGWYESYRVWGGVERRPVWAERWDEGRGELIQAENRWLEENLSDMQGFLR
ncbi:MAG: phosphotransferase [Actinomycetota bacterium]|nr:phosphotransferase [Actinomycetota bacterium]